MQNSTDPLILAIDTSAGRSSVALWQGTCLAHAADDVAGQQSRTLVLMIESVLLEAGKKHVDCDAIACALGPGGFTSVRVGISAAKAIALVLDKPFIGVNSLEVMAFASGITGDAVAVIDAHRSQFYAQRFRLLGMPVAQSQPLLVEEPGLKALAHGAKRTDTPINAQMVAEYAQALWTTGIREFPNEPLYVREPDAKLPA